jgi:hypothetical protein
VRFGVRAPGQQRIYAAGAYYPGLPILGPVCIRPPSLHSPVSNPEPPETGMCMPRMQRLDTTFRTAMAFTLRVLGGRLCSRVRPGGRWFRGTFSRTEERDLRRYRCSSYV